MVRRNRIRLVLSVCLLTVIALFTIYFICIRNMPYEKDYFGAVGISGYNYSYYSMIADFGEPMSVEITKNGAAVYHYNDLCFMFNSDYKNSAMLNIVVTSEKYEFGSAKIHVGSTKQEVLKAYRHVRRSPDEGIVFMDGDIYVRFIFDQSDKVSEIFFCDYYFSM